MEYLEVIRICDAARLSSHGALPDHDQRIYTFEVR